MDDNGGYCHSLPSYYLCELLLPGYRQMMLLSFSFTVNSILVEVCKFQNMLFAAIIDDHAKDGGPEVV